MRITRTLATCTALLVSATGVSVVMAVGAVGSESAADATKAAKIRNAMSAAPRSVSGDATILDYPAKANGDLVTLRKGSNGWTCLPNDPNTPGNDPICADGQSMKWFDAWFAHAKPHLSADGFAYMLQGGSDPSNSDPFATEPAAGEDWMNVGPHVMVFPKSTKSLKGVSRDMDNGGPWKMYGGTPYAHMMIPVTSSHEGMNGIDVGN
ncbi:MAG TPA: hypothetical protein VMZ00_07805 [Sporichthya sp.]|nr:hypothetical protein [Sporichthya sp.]